jgi:hypothetical protein
MKTCKACNIKKVNAEFYTHRKNKDGLTGYCKMCIIAFNSKRYATLEKKAKPLVTAARDRAKRKKLEFCLTEAMIAPRIIRGVCELTGIAFDLNYKGSSHKNPYSPSIDRIDSHKGYVLSNVRVVLTAVNIALGEDGEEVMYPILKAMVEAIENAKQKQLTSVPTEHTGEGQDNSQFGTIHGAGVGQDCDGAHHHRREPEGQDLSDSTKAGCRICMGTGVQKMATLATFYGNENNGDTLCSAEEFAKRIRCLCYQP